MSMGYTVWDRKDGGPAVRKVYKTAAGAALAASKLNTCEPRPEQRFYVKPL